MTKKEMYIKYGFTEEEAEKAVKNAEAFARWQESKKAMQTLYRQKTGKRKR